MDNVQGEKRNRDNDWRLWKQKRYVVAALSFAGFFSAYLLRVNLSVAIVDMTEIKTVTLANGTIIYSREFDWDTRIQGYILGAFFYGYASTQLIGGYLGARFGGKRVFGMGIAATALLTVLTPWVARWNVYLFLILRTLEGICEGVSTPCIYEIWSKWAPPLERTRLMATSMAGVSAGTVVGMFLSGYLINVFGWVSVFYSFGIFGLVWYLVWTFAVADTPEEDRTISYKELKYITDSLKGANSTRKPNKIPWKHILTSRPVWAMIISHFCENWGLFTMLTQLPKFMKRVFKFDLNDSGFLSTLPYLLFGISMQVSAQLADMLITKNVLTVTQTRKLLTCTGFLIQVVFMMSAAFWLSPIVTTACLTIAVGLGAMSYNGFCVNYLDVAPNYASIMLGFGNTFGSLSGVISPILTGYIVTDEFSADQWKIILYVASGIYFVGMIIYGACASGELQPWAVDSRTPRDEDVQEEDPSSVHLT